MAPTKHGRPRRGYEAVPVLVRFPASMLERIAAYHAQIASHDWRLTSRQDVILMLCEHGLQAVEQVPAPFTPPTTVGKSPQETSIAQPVRHDLPSDHGKTGLQERSREAHATSVEARTLPEPVAGMQWCRKGLHQYPVAKPRCPQCHSARSRQAEARQAAKAQTVGGR